MTIDNSKYAKLADEAKEKAKFLLLQRKDLESVDYVIEAAVLKVMSMIKKEALLDTIPCAWDVLRGYINENMLPPIGMPYTFYIVGEETCPKDIYIWDKGQYIKLAPSETIAVHPSFR